jgi:phospholipase C
MRGTRVLAGALCLGFLIVGAVARMGGASTPPTAVLTASSATPDMNKIKHVVIVMQENRSFDEYFGMYPGADGFTLDQSGTPTNCAPDPRTHECVPVFHDTDDIDRGGPHSATAAERDVDGGKMDGFIASWLHACQPTNPNCGGGKPVPDVMGYRLRSDIPNYWAYADNFTLFDHMFTPAASWSLPEHLYMVSDWSARCSRPGDASSCENDVSTPYLHVGPDGKPPSYAWTDLTYLLDKGSVPWGYYVFDGTEPDCEDPGEISCIPAPQSSKTGSIWNPLPQFSTVQDDHQTQNVQSIQHFVAAARAGTLPAVSWVVPSQPISDHPPASIAASQDYATYVINQVMQSADWSSTAIFFGWDDWGGFYDHVVPPTIDANGDGLRVPMMLISPYAKPGYIDHSTYTFDSTIRFIEDRFLGGARLDPTSDGRPDPRPTVRENAPTTGDLRNAFDFAQSPLPPLVLPTVSSGSQLAQPMPAIPPPAKQPKAVPISGPAPFAVHFDGSASSAPAGAIAGWRLNFGDGTAAAHGTGAPPSSIAHTYTSAGEYRAALAVTDDTGTSSKATQAILVSADTRPTAWIWGKPATAFSSANVTFDASQSQPGTWTLDFGDGAPALHGTGVPPSSVHHTYSTPGLYTATITVVDGQGASSVARANTLISTVRPPAVIPQVIKSITSDSAKPSARVYADGAPTTAYYEYGTTKDFGSQTPPQHVTRETGVAVIGTLTGLSPSTKYYYRLVASSSAGTVREATKSFMTRSQ